MNLRRALSILAIAAIATSGAACSSKKDEAKKGGSTTTEVAKNGKDDSSIPSSTVDDGEFKTQMEKIRSGIESAGSDECKLLEAVSTNPPQPANPTQTKEFVQTYVALLNAIGDKLGADTDNGKATKEAAQQFQKIAEDKKYDTGLLETEEISKLMTSEKVSAALLEFSSVSQKCMGQQPGAEAPAGSETTAPAN